MEWCNKKSRFKCNRYRRMEDKTEDCNGDLNYSHKRPGMVEATQSEEVGNAATDRTVEIIFCGSCGKPNKRLEEIPRSQRRYYFRMPFRTCFQMVLRMKVDVQFHLQTRILQGSRDNVSHSVGVSNVFPSSTFRFVPSCYCQLESDLLLTNGHNFGWENWILILLTKPKKWQLLRNNPKRWPWSSKNRQVETKAQLSKSECEDRNLGKSASLTNPLEIRILFNPNLCKPNLPKNTL